MLSSIIKLCSKLNIGAREEKSQICYAGGGKLFNPN